MAGANKCTLIYDETYADFIGRGYATTEAAAAAEAAFSACLARSAGTVNQAVVSVPGGRQYDSGPSHARSKSGTPKAPK
jgi:hypothetical protein